MTGKRPSADPVVAFERKSTVRQSDFMTWRLPQNVESDPARIEWALRERIKELNCLYALAQLAESESGSMEGVLNAIVNLIPPSWQYPEITCARITFQDLVFKSPNFEVTSWRQSSTIHVYGEPAGEVTVCYLKECSPSFEGPFLHEERALIDAIAERTGDIFMRISAEEEIQEKNRQLELERQALRETNDALKTILARIEEEKNEIHMDIRNNVDKVLMPIINELEISMPAPKRKLVKLLRDNLEEITSSFASHLSDKFHSLTPAEIHICTMIKSGLGTKEIAELRNVSPATVSRQREQVRRKLGLVNMDVNLATYLRASM
ncbi:MAG: helix-turn-helix transcriptional regulator [bacterium]